MIKLNGKYFPYCRFKDKPMNTTTLRSKFPVELYKLPDNAVKVANSGVVRHYFSLIEVMVN